MWLWGSMIRPGVSPSGVLHGPRSNIGLGRLAQESCFNGRLEEFRGRCVIVAMHDQLSAALAMIELDGVARRMVLCPPDLSSEVLEAAIQKADANAWVGDSLLPASGGLAIKIAIAPEPRGVHSSCLRMASFATEWILLTSGTTGTPKLIQHTLETLTKAFIDQARARQDIVWSTFYDIRRYGGLQIFLRSLFDGSMVISSDEETVANFLRRASEARVTHISGTASHWRRALMSGAASTISPRYVRLSGEIADQAILDGLKAAYPHATVAHAFATTEAGVAFEVEDGLAGFPESLVNTSASQVDIKIKDGTLRLRSAGSACGYLGDNVPRLRDGDGFIDTTDRVELRDGRYHFVGRSSGVINVGGLKVHPEEVETVINSHPWVRMSLVKARRSPITGSVVAAEVVPIEGENTRDSRPSDQVLEQEIIERCRQSLAAYKVPVTVRVVDELEISAAGKLVRPNA